MNLFFYLGINRIDLGKSVAIEFIGPIAVAAATTRTSRNAGALALAVAGVIMLGGVELAGNALGVFFILLSSAMWAPYIVVGSRVAQIRRGVAGLGVAWRSARRDHADRRAGERAGVVVTRPC